MGFIGPMASPPVSRVEALPPYLNPCKQRGGGCIQNSLKQGETPGEAQKPDIEPHSRAAPLKSRG